MPTSHPTCPDQSDNELINEKGIQIVEVPLQVDRQYEMALKRLYSDTNAQFRSLQQFQACWALNELKGEYVVYVERTGGGKTTVLQLAASMKSLDQVVVYVSPYNVLTTLLPAEMRGVHLRCALYSNNMNDIPQILVIPLEKMVEIGVKELLNSLYGMGRLYGIVVDEIRKKAPLRLTSRYLTNGLV